MSEVGTIAGIVSAGHVAWAMCIEAQTSRVPDNQPMHPISSPVAVTVYGADWCGDCRRSKRLLVARNTAFDWVDVAAEPAIRDELTSNGYPAIPVIVLPDGSILMEPSDEELGLALDALAARGDSA